MNIDGYEAGSNYIKAGHEINGLDEVDVTAHPRVKLK